MEDLFNSFLTKRFLPGAKLGETSGVIRAGKNYNLCANLLYQTFSCTAGDDSSTNEDEYQHFLDQIHKHCSL